ncbi:HAF repeat-containing protein [Tundrisphaera sp. TA3]|uniref:HAF repeat-containing protein n=1 Tax=Tundrisphaera sp. TA3 TaxID=3435775 RepID=UPI003EBA6CCF
MARPFWIFTLLASAAIAADEPRKYEVVTPKPTGIVGIDINEKGDVLGYEWVEEKELPGVISQVPFLAKGGKADAMARLPLLPTYTFTFPAALSDTGLVVGHVGKPPGRPGTRVLMRTQAFAWDEAGGIRGLGVLPDDWASIASGVTRDGRCISGYSVGENRVRACIWERDGDGWKGTALPHAEQLRSNVVPISPDGRYIAAVENLTPCLWTRGADGAWTREAIGGSNSIFPRAVDDAGRVVGLKHGDNDGHNLPVLWTREGGCKTLELPEGYVGGEAVAINARGEAVGFVDGPHGGEIGPNGFVYADGKLRIITEGGPTFSSATGINDRGQIVGVVEQDEEAPPPARPATP